jgi:glycosyltransferase involved in cell wall biosynthesis
MSKKVVFMIKGKKYSGAEIVLDRFLNKSKLIEPYFLLVDGSDKIEKRYKTKYSQNKIFNLNRGKIDLMYKLAPPVVPYVLKKEIINIVQRIKPDVFYANNTLEAVFASKAIEKIEAVSIVHIHDMVNSLRHPVMKKYLPIALKKYDKLLTVSDACRVELDSVGLSADVVYNGIEHDYFAEKISTSKPLSIAFVGSLIKRKGVDVLMKALSKISLKSVSEIIIAYNYCQNDFFDKTLSKIKHIDKEVRIMKSLDSNEVETLYKQIDLLVVPSRRDPLPTTVMEGMAKGVTVVGSNVDGIPEMIGESRFLFKPNNVDSMTAIISKILKKDSSFFEKNGAKMIRRAKQKFGLSNKVKRVNNIIKNS